MLFLEGEIDRVRFVNKNLPIGIRGASTAEFQFNACPLDEKFESFDLCEMFQNRWVVVVNVLGLILSSY